MSCAELLEPVSAALRSQLSQKHLAACSVQRLIGDLVERKILNAANMLYIAVIL